MNGPEQSIHDLEWSLRTYNVLVQLGVSSVAQLASMTAARLLAEPDSTPRMLREVERALAAFGLTLASGRSVAGAPEPSPPEDDWGALFAWHEGPGGWERVREVVLDAYTQAGLSPVAWERADPLAVQPLELPALAVEVRQQLDEDDVIVRPVSERGWIAVLSGVWEWAPIAHHPLAERLSHKVEVLSVKSVARTLCEVTRYAGGRTIQTFIAGQQSRPTTVPGASLDFGWLEARGAFVAATDLERYASNPDRLLALLGIDSRGYRDAFERAPLADYDPREVLFFRRA